MNIKYTLFLTLILSSLSSLKSYSNDEVESQPYYRFIGPVFVEECSDEMQNFFKVEDLDSFTKYLKCIKEKPQKDDLNKNNAVYNNVSHEICGKDEDPLTIEGPSPSLAPQSHQDLILSDKGSFVELVLKKTPMCYIVESGSEGFCIESSYEDDEPTFLGGLYNNYLSLKRYIDGASEIGFVVTKSFRKNDLAIKIGFACDTARIFAGLIEDAKDVSESLDSGDQAGLISKGGEILVTYSFQIFLVSKYKKSFSSPKESFDASKFKKYRRNLKPFKTGFKFYGTYATKKSTNAWGSTFSARSKQTYLLMLPLRKIIFGSEAYDTCSLRYLSNYDKVHAFVLGLSQLENLILQIDVIKRAFSGEEVFSCKDLSTVKLFSGVFQSILLWRHGYNGLVINRIGFDMSYWTLVYFVELVSVYYFCGQ